MSFNIFRKQVTNKISRYLPSNALILDLAGGKGQDTELFKAKGFNVILDNTTDLNTKHLPYSNNTFDCVYLNGAYRFINNKHAFWTEVTRILKPNGFLAIRDTKRNCMDSLDYSPIYNVFLGRYPYYALYPYPNWLVIGQKGWQLNRKPDDVK